MAPAAISVIALSAVALLSGSARPGDVFITSDTTVAGMVTDTSYIVGKDAGLNTLPGSITLNITGDTFPDFDNAIGPYGFMRGINVSPGYEEPSVVSGPSISRGWRFPS